MKKKKKKKNLKKLIKFFFKKKTKEGWPAQREVGAAAPTPAHGDGP
jgi:hypothetical protein